MIFSLIDFLVINWIAFKQMHLIFQNVFVLNLI